MALMHGIMNNECFSDFYVRISRETSKYQKLMVFLKSNQTPLLMSSDSRGVRVCGFLVVLICISN